MPFDLTFFSVLQVDATILCLWLCATLLRLCCDCVFLWLEANGLLAFLVKVGAGNFVVDCGRDVLLPGLCDVYKLS